LEEKIVVVGGRSPRAKWISAGLRIAFGVVWLVDAWFKWQPSFRDNFVGMISGAAAGQPTWLKPWFHFWQLMFSPAPTFFAYVIAIGETLLGVALIFGFARGLTYLFGLAWSLMIWTTAEGFGRTSSGPATDIGTAIVYAVVFASLLALNSSALTRSFSLDEFMESRLGWWVRLAELPARRVNKGGRATFVTR
jgi:uncharacterized membrane protein YphA (DoxX/SURF4 family)